jgi:hypothetical protein
VEILSYFVIVLGDLKLLTLCGDFKLLCDTAWRFEVTDSGDFKLLCNTAWRFEVTDT